MSSRTRNAVLVVAVGSILAFTLASCSQQSGNRTPAGGQTSAGEQAAPSGQVAGGPPASDPVKRGQYLVQTIGCGHCHTPGGIYGEPDPTRFMSGSEVGWEGRWGVSYPRNLTPDSATGIGKWTEEQIVTAIRTLKRPDGTTLHLP